MWKRVAVSMTICVASAALAQDSLKVEAAFRLAAPFVELACPAVSMNVSQNTWKAQGDAKLELQGLIKKLANLGFGAATSYETEQSQGPLRKDLAAVQKDMYTCRYRTLELIITRLLKLPEPKFIPDKTITRVRQVASVGPPRLRPALSGPIVRVFYKNNLTPQHLALLASKLPHYDLRPGKSGIDPVYPADTIFVNREKVTKGEVLTVLAALDEIGIEIRSIQQQRVGGRREIQVGTVASDTKGISEFSALQKLHVGQLERLDGPEFWRSAFNGKVFCPTPDNMVIECQMDAAGFPVTE